MKYIVEQLDAKAQSAAVQPDADLLSFGYAPGNYESFCLTCEQRMTGVDKRCHCCRPCAKEKWGAAEKAKINQRQVPEGMALYKGEFVTARMVVERLVEAERLLRICTDGREAYIKSVNTFLEITKFLGTADSDEWPTREEAEKRAAELMAIGRATLAAADSAPDVTCATHGCTYRDGTCIRCWGRDAHSKAIDSLLDDCATVYGGPFPEGTK